MNWSYCWRTKRRTEQEQQYLTIDPHSPPEFRANIVRNLDEFHEAFGTAAGRRPVARPERPRPDLVTRTRRTRVTGAPRGRGVAAEHPSARVVVGVSRRSGR